MYIVRIEHPVPDFIEWKKVFDNDPLGRGRMGVRRHRIMRDADDPNYVLADLEFDTLNQARAMLAALKTLWGRVEGTVISGPRARIVEQLEEKIP
jgi:hypothetical protein